ncbi:MAG: InlB B-repeat-containing protein [Firmicutes bacterium]|nr:InlB B-repeat-containing protein [Bacillota bacterium]
MKKIGKMIFWLCVVLWMGCVVCVACQPLQRDDGRGGFVVRYHGHFLTGGVLEQKVQGGQEALCPKKQVGYVFLGWFVDKEYAGPKLDKLPAKHHGILNLFGCWREQEYGIQYRGMSHLSQEKQRQWAKSAPTKHRFGGHTQLPTPQKYGHILEGWCQKKDKSDRPLHTLGAKQITEPITLYAKFVPIQTNIRCIHCEETSPSAWAHTFGTVTHLSPQSKRGHLFEGYFDNAEFVGDKILRIVDSKESSHNATHESGDWMLGYGDSIEPPALYAKFVPQKYAIVYDLGEGVLRDNAPKQHTFGADTRLMEPKKLGHKFCGWYLDKDFSGDTVAVLCGDDYTEDIGLFAKFEPLVYRIGYEPNGGQMPRSAPAMHPCGGRTQLKEPLRYGFDFLGWYDNPALEGERVTVLDNTNTLDDLTLYAKWEETCE